MEENSLSNTCDFASLRPVMVDLPYPPIQVEGQNLAYANLISMDYCGSVSEMTALTQYINNENRLSCNNCSVAKTLLGIAMSEMIHLQKLGELIFLLGGTVDFVARPHNGRPVMWTPECLKLPDQLKAMLLTDVEGEYAAINQYRMHIRMIKDAYVNAVLERIIKDEEYHIMLLQWMLKEL